MSEHFSLQWDNFHKNMSAGMQSLLESEDLVDVTLAVEGRHLKAHKMVLSLCSPYFRQLFQSSPCKHPIVFMKDVSYIALSDLLQFMYQGEVQVAQENLPTFIKTAEALQIKGLTGDSTNQNEESIETTKSTNEAIKRTAEVLVPSPIQSVTRVKKYTGPASKRVRVSSPSPSSSAAAPVVPAEVAVETDNSNVASNIENAILMKMEPSDNIEASTAKEVADQTQDSYVDESLVEEDAEDYTLMETNEDDPKPGTSFDGIGESQDHFLPSMDTISFTHLELPSCPSDISIRENVNIDLFSPKKWEEIIREKGGESIINTYRKEGFLSNSERMKLVKITVGNLVERYGIKVPESAKRNLGEAIVTLFPNLRDPLGKYGYEAYYSNHNGGEGYISWRLRTIARNRHDINRRTRKKRFRKAQVQEDKHESVTIAKTAEVEEALDFLKNIDHVMDRDTIRKKMVLTFAYRRSLGINVLKQFPRFINHSWLIEEDFQQLYPNIQINFEQVFGKDIDKIIKIYQTTVKYPNSAIIYENEAKSNLWNKSTKALFALMQMLPSLPSKKNKAKCKTYTTPEDKLIIFKPPNTTIAEIISTNNNIRQPYIIAVGSTKSTITDYCLVVDQSSISCASPCSVLKAFELLFKAHFIFGIEYDDQLDNFYKFIQSYYFKIETQKLIFTSKMIELRTRLVNN